MSEVVKVASVGDHDPAVTAHLAIPEALRLSAQRLGLRVEPIWVPTAALVGPVEGRLSAFRAVWCVPGRPYANTEGALASIRLCRESGRAFLGTCGGFEHAVLEYVQNALGHREAAHAETSPETVMPVIARLTCSLVEKAGTVVLRRGSRLRAIYGAGEAHELYHCNYGVNPEYERLFADGSGLRVSARDPAGEVRAIELAGHPLFLATLFQPERSALRGVEHPLITAFVAAASGTETG